MGRVVSGIEVLRILKNNYHFEIRLFTYFNGVSLAEEHGFAIDELGDVGQSDLTDIGLLPVSSIGSKIIKSIIDWNPDMVILDGEPLLCKALSMVYSKKRIITLINPCDIENPHTPLSNNLFFRDCYLSSGITICHGFITPQQQFYYPQNHLYYANTILRKSIFTIKEDRKFKKDNVKKRLSCILGGGAKNAPKTMLSSTIEIGKHVIAASNYLDGFQIDIFTNDKDVSRELTKYVKNDSIVIHNNYCLPTELYRDADFVICRSGRNTISELLFLGIPAILISAGLDFRGKEQSYNIKQAEKISRGNITGYDVSMSEQILACLIEEKTKSRTNSCNFVPGNDQIMGIIEDFIKTSD